MAEGFELRGEDGSILATPQSATYEVLETNVDKHFAVEIRKSEPRDQPRRGALALLSEESSIWYCF